MEAKLKELESKIELLTEDVEYFKTENKQLSKDKQDWIMKYNDLSIEKAKYRHAFEALFELINSKR